MKKKKSILEKLSSGRGFYIIAALCFVMIIGAIAFIYNSSLKLIGELDFPKAQTTQEHPDQWAQQNITGQADPRYEEETTEEPDTTEMQTTATVTVAETTTMPATAAGTVFSNRSFDFPVPGEILKDYSDDTPVYDETMGDWRIHRAIDFAAEKGSEVYSIGNGKVVKITAEINLGYCVEVDYGEFTARYCGLEQGTTVLIDEIVKKGDVIGKTGDIPCEKNQQSHLHFETKSGEVYVDPLKAMKK